MRVVTWNMDGKVERWASIVPQWLDLYDVICIQHCGEPQFLSEHDLMEEGFQTYEGIIKNKKVQYNYVFCRVPYTRGRSFNLAILSKHPLENKRIVADSQNWRVPSLGVSVYNTNIYTLLDFSERKDSAPRLLEAIYEEHPNETIIVLGDFHRNPFSNKRWTLHYLASSTRKNNKEFDFAFSRGLNRILIKHIPMGKDSNFAVKYKLRKN